MGAIYIYSWDKTKLVELATELWLDIGLIREDSNTEKMKKLFYFLWSTDLW